MLFCEIIQILNHLLALTTHAMDVGALIAIGISSMRCVNN